MSVKSQRYRDVIDSLVHACREGQGQVGPKRARNGLWNANAGPDSIPDQYAINQLLESLSPSHRETLATMLSQAFEGGAFAALVALEEHEIPPFEDGYEGSAYHDFIGRLDGWQWPE